MQAYFHIINESMRKSEHSALWSTVVPGCAIHGLCPALLKPDQSLDSTARRMHPGLSCGHQRQSPGIHSTMVEFTTAKGPKPSQNLPLGISEKWNQDHGPKQAHRADGLSHERTSLEKWNSQTMDFSSSQEHCPMPRQKAPAHMLRAGIRTVQVLPQVQIKNEKDFLTYQK